VPSVLRSLVPSAYRPVLANRVAWLAIERAPRATAGLWVGGAVAAYTLPGVVGALVFGRRLRRVPARRLLLADNVACFTLGGAIYGPFVALSVTLMQAKSPPQHLATMLAARGAALLTASPLGTALGGPLTAALGPRATLGASGLATVVLGAVACVLLLARRRNRDLDRSGIEKHRSPSRS
jgi:predicted MFS family arabinose efflux permease